MVFNVGVVACTGEVFCGIINRAIFRMKFVLLAGFGNRSTVVYKCYCPCFCEGSWVIVKVVLIPIDNTTEMMIVPNFMQINLF